MADAKNNVKLQKQKEEKIPIRGDIYERRLIESMSSNEFVTHGDDPTSEIEKFGYYYGCGPKYELSFTVQQDEDDQGYPDRSIGLDKFGNAIIGDESEDEDIIAEEVCTIREMSGYQEVIPESMKPIFEFACQSFEFSSENSSYHFDNEYWIGLRCMRSLNMARKVVINLEKQLAEAKAKIAELENTKEGKID